MAAIPGSVRVGGFIAPTDDTDTYAVTDPLWGREGWRCVTNKTIRNAITRDRRRVGMAVWVQDDSKFYILINEPETTQTTDTDWQSSDIKMLGSNIYLDDIHNTINLSTKISTGLISGGNLYIYGPDISKYGINAGKGVIVDRSSPDDIVLTFVSWTAAQPLSVPYIDSHATTWVGVDSSGNKVTQPYEFTAQQLKSIIRIGRLSHFGRGQLDDAFYAPLFYNDNLDLARNIIAYGTTRLKGGNISANGSNLNLNVEALTCCCWGSNAKESIGGDLDNPHIVSLPASSPFPFFKAYRASDASTLLEPSVTDLDPTKYDNGSGTLQTVPASNYTIQSAVLLPLGNPKRVIMFYGQQIYSSMDDAINNSTKDWPVIYDDIFGGVMLGRVIIRQDVTDLSAAIIAGTAKILSGTYFGTLKMQDIVPTSGGTSEIVRDIFPSKPVYVKKFGDDKAEIYYPLGTVGTGFINVAADFPAGWGGVTQGDCYTIPYGVTVTDNDPTKTNTGQTFIGPLQIAADKISSKWIERDGLTIETCVSSIMTADYLQSIYADYPNYAPIICLDDSTYNFGDGSGTGCILFAEFAKLNLLGNFTTGSRLIIFDTVIANGIDANSGWFIANHPDNVTEIIGRHAYFGAVAASSGMFINIGTSDLILNIGKINGALSTQKTLVSNIGKIYANVGKFIGLVSIDGAGGEITLNTLDKTDLTIDDTLGTILLTANSVVERVDLTATYGNWFVRPITPTDGVVSNGGFIDTNAAAAINLTDASNPAFATRNKTFCGSTNEIASTIGQQYKEGLNFYLDNTLLIPAGSENLNPIYNLTRTPTISAQYEAYVSVDNTTPKIYAGYLFNSKLNMIHIDAGVWCDKTWCRVSDNSATTEIIKSICLVENDTPQRVTTTGSGEQRTATLTGGLITFTASDENIDPTLASYIETSSGLYQIIDFTSPSIATIKTPSTYTNENNTAFQKWANRIRITTGDIKNTTAQEITSFSNVSQSYSQSQNGSLGVLAFAKTTSATPITVYMRYNGNSQYSHIETPKFYQRKSVFFPAETNYQVGTHRGKLMSYFLTFQFNFYIPEDVEYIDGINLIYSATNSTSGVDIDLTTNYTVTRGGSISEYSATDNTSTYLFVNGNLGYIPFKTLIINAKHGTFGGLQIVSNSSGAGNFYVYGIELFYR